MILDHTIVLTNEDAKKIFAEELNSTWNKFSYLIDSKYERISHKTFLYDWFNESKRELTGVSLDTLNKIKSPEKSLRDVFIDDAIGFDFEDDAMEILDDGGILQFFYDNADDGCLLDRIFLFKDNDGEVKEFDYDKKSKDYPSVSDYLKYRNNK